MNFRRCDAQHTAQIGRLPPGAERAQRAAQIGKLPGLDAQLVREVLHDIQQAERRQEASPAEPSTSKVRVCPPCFAVGVHAGAARGPVHVGCQQGPLPRS